MLDGNRRCPSTSLPFVLLAALLLCVVGVRASVGDHLKDFKACVKSCKETNCDTGILHVPLHRRLLLWDCPWECDYACQHIITEQRLARDPPFLHPILQFHGKWPFYRFLGVQEPASVLFSLMNLLAHTQGIAKLKEAVPSSYPLRKYYLGFGYFGVTSWIFSIIFHTRDSILTEQLDYYAAGASVMYSLYYSVIRIYRLDKPRTRQNGAAAGSSGRPNTYSILRPWTFFCASLFSLHVSYLLFIDFSYTYNMAANVGVGIIQNILWTIFAINRYKKVGRTWAAWPGMIVAWLTLAMSLELYDFPPWWGMLDAHALWHLGTIIPTIWWYNFLIKDAEEDMLATRLKA